MYNFITIIGYLGADPELRFTADGKAVANFSLAASNAKDDTTWYRVTVWDEQAEACAKYLTKGRLVLVTGRLQHDGKGNPRVFTRKSGEVGSSFEVTAQRVVFLGGKQEVDQEVIF